MNHSEVRSGRIRWFDQFTGKGIVTDSLTGREFRLHYSAIDCPEARRSVSNAAKAVESGDVVIFRYLDDPDFSVVAWLQKATRFPEATLSLAPAFQVAAQ